MSRGHRAGLGLRGPHSLLQVRAPTLPPPGLVVWPTPLSHQIEQRRDPQSCVWVKYLGLLSCRLSVTWHAVHPDVIPELLLQNLIDVSNPIYYS